MTGSYSSFAAAGRRVLLPLLLGALLRSLVHERAATISASSISQQRVKQAQPQYAASNTAQPQHQQATPNRQRKPDEVAAGKLAREPLKRRSEAPEEDQLVVPLATVNNHSSSSRANASATNANLGQGPRLRPPQYVDLDALVGRNASNPMQLASSPANSISANSPLSPKSRSGLPECATQQVCNAIFVRMNYTQRLCECSQNYNWKCSNNLDPQDGHTIELTRKFDKRIYTQIKTCEPLREVRACKSPTDWTLLALQSERSGKAHYVVVCKCPTWAQLEGPYTHNHPPYANIPGIRVYGMLCAHQTARSSSAQTYSSQHPALGIYPEFPWSEALNVLNTTNMANNLHF